MMEKSIRRKWFGRFLFRAAMGLLIPCVVWAEQVDLDEGVTLNYTVVNGSVHIGNTNAPFAAVSTDISGRLVLPETIEGLAVTDIGAFAFEGCTRLTEVVLPASVTNVGESAFRDCSGLDAIKFPNGLVSIGKNAFRECESLQSLNFPSSLHILNDGAFAKCRLLRSIVIPGGVKVLGELVSSKATIGIVGQDEADCGVFQGCEALEAVTIINGVKELGYQAFRRCRNLSAVTLPESLKLFRTGVFSECPALQNMELPSGVRAIGVPWVKVVTNTTIQGGVSVVERHSVNQFVTSRDGVFFRCTGLRNIQIPGTVARLGDYAFAGCTGLASVVFLGDEPTVEGCGLFLGTHENLVVSVRKDALGWYDPLTFGTLSTWNGRTVAYDGEILASKPLDVDAVATRFADLTSILQSTGTDERGAYVQWGMRLVQSCPESLPIYVDFLRQIGATLTSAESASLTAWAASAVSSGQTEGGTSDSSSPTASASGVIEANLTVTNVVMHYVQEVETAPSAEALPADGLVAVISEVKGSAAIPVPCSWTNSYPRFAEMFGTDFVSALTKPTGKVGPNGTPLLVWQDYVAGTDPTDPASKFTATIDFVDGHPVVTWSPKVEDATFPRVYRIYGKVSLSDADWTELPKDKLDGYNFFKVTVEMAGK